ncbi:uncharacterized protein [Mycetomoellerius zeteki]|uniref:uncharacterized protein isoform X2 n=1 Tax=Mycetomoellerius zeteki TaxID=64791 RepID=UPI00084E69E6|nr:PREDICTED: uncharacterized protein LOC108723142 isoform X2 [Trachymyrmex zeteki]
MQGWFNRDEEGKVIIDNNGFVTITCEGNEENVVFQLHISEIDEKAEQMCFNVNGKDIYIDVVPFETNDNDFEGDKTMSTLIGSESKESKEEKFTTPTTSKNGNAIFPWCDASTKIFLKEYKLKKELVKHRKLKNMKRAYQEIANNLMENGFSVSPLQVENRYKTLKRAYKNMVTHNRRSGRGKYICSYEDDLVEIFSNDIYDTKMNDEDYTKDMKETETFHLKTLQHNARLEAQNVKIIENLQSCQRLLKNLITSLDSKNKNSNHVPSGILQMCMEMRDIQKEANSRAEEQREKAKEQREKRNNLLEEIVTILKSRKDT